MELMTFKLSESEDDCTNDEMTKFERVLSTLVDRLEGLHVLIDLEFFEKHFIDPSTFVLPQRKA